MSKLAVTVCKVQRGRTKARVPLEVPGREQPHSLEGIQRSQYGSHYWLSVISGHRYYLITIARECTQLTHLFKSQVVAQ